MTQKGKVVKKEKEIVWVQLFSPSECIKCGAKLVCKGEHKVEVLNGIGTKIGDTVEIEFDEKKSLKAGILLFLFPIAVFMGIFVESARIFEGEGIPFMCGLIGMVGAFFLLHKIDKKIKKNKKLMPKITRIIEK
jgi:positive regulator of sigma E activity